MKFLSGRDSFNLLTTSYHEYIQTLMSYLMTRVLITGEVDVNSVFISIQIGIIFVNSLKQQNILSMSTKPLKQSHSQQYRISKHQQFTRANNNSEPNSGNNADETEQTVGDFEFKIE